MQTNEGKYARLDDKPYESHYLYVETIIDHPVEKVWPHALRIGKWMTAHQMETIAGEAGTIGHFERVFPRGLGAEVPEPHYHLYGIAEIIPLKLIAMEVFPERGGSYGKKRDWVMFDSILFTDLGSRTHIGFLLVDMHLGPDEAKDLQKLQEVEKERALIRQRLGEFFENLRQLVSNAS